MNKYILILLILCQAASSVGQGNEFPTYSNGLIYDSGTMHRLGVIVDSLNIKFRSCDLAHPYYSHPQGYAYFVSVDSKQARSQIRQGITLEAYVKKYGKEMPEKMWILRSVYTYGDEKRIEYSGLPYGWNSEPGITVSYNKTNNVTHGWVLDEDGERAVFIEKLTHYTLPHEYARLVQYVDCMIDTSAQIFLEDADRGLGDDEGPKTIKYLEWANDFPNEPTAPEYGQLSDEAYERAAHNYWTEYTAWDSLRMLDLDKRMQRDSYGRNLLEGAATEALESGVSGDKLEFYVARYGAKSDALRLMRSRRVVGGCSMDTRPRRHAMSICKLAAETASWDIFLRSHLDIMNDRFERASDGSYAWAGRKTYLKELELLDIDAIDLLVGTSLRVENVSDNHYWGSIGRVGRALADAGDKDQLEKRLLAMIGNNNLDPYNRLLIAYLFNSYAYNLSDESRKKQCVRTLEDSVNTLPAYVREVWNKEER